MYASAPLPDSARLWAARQSGVLSRSQLVGCGLGDGQIARFNRQSVLTRLDRGLYLLGAGEPVFESWVWGAVLLGGPGSRVLGRTAAALEELVPKGLPIHLGVPAERDLDARTWLRVRRERETSRPASLTGAPPRTLIEDTLLDLAVDCTEQELVWAVTTACARLTTPARVERALAKRVRIRHRRLLHDMVGVVHDGVRSPLELRWVRCVERPHRLPRPTRPYVLPDGTEADGAYEEFRVLLELDGRRWHDGERRFRDWRRDNGNSEADWLTLRYGWPDVVGGSCGTAGNLARVLQRRGWTGELRRCPACH